MAELVLSRPGFSDSAERHWSQVVPLGIAYLAAAARARGITVGVVDGKLEGHLTIDQTVEAIRSHHPDVVGLSALTIEYPTACDIALRLKESGRGPVTVLGGSHANALPESCLEECSAFDYLIAGEGESVLVDLLLALQNGAAPATTPGLYGRDDEGCVHGKGHATLQEDPSRLPFPAWDLFPRLDVYPIMGERGCPYRCVFCSRNMTNQMQSRPIDHVMEELEWLHRDFAPNEIYFEDETFGLRRDYTEELLHRIIEFNKEKGISFKAQTRVDCVNRPMMSLMKRAGFGYCELGVESGDPKVLARSQKEPP